MVRVALQAETRKAKNKCELNFISKQKQTNKNKKYKLFYFVATIFEIGAACVRWCFGYIAHFISKKEFAVCTPLLPSISFVAE
jgi:hypothetical protein